MLRALLLGLGLLAVTSCVSAAVESARSGPVVIWLEGEHPSRANFEYDVEGWGSVFSDGKWLHVGLSRDQVPDPVPEGGMALAYELDAPNAGPYELWLRLGFEWVRAPLQWRVNGGEWTRFGPEDLTTNLLEIGVWAEVGWGRLGSVDLREGRNVLDIRCVEPGRDGRLVIGLDCIAFVEGEGNFTPEGVLRPGQQYDAEIDGLAAGHVFRLPARSEGATRVELPLDGPWQVARHDDPDMDVDTYEPVKALPSPDDYELRWRGINVPGNARSRADLKFGHRLLYRARVEVPATYEGRGFYLHFSGTNWIAGVFVNGQYGTWTSREPSGRARSTPSPSASRAVGMPCNPARTRRWTTCVTGPTKATSRGITVSSTPSTRPARAKGTAWRLASSIPSGWL